MYSHANGGGTHRPARADARKGLVRGVSTSEFSEYPWDHPEWHAAARADGRKEGRKGRWGLEYAEYPSAAHTASSARTDRRCWKEGRWDCVRSGAAFHAHADAWSIVMSGAKRWFIYSVGTADSRTRAFAGACTHA